MGTKIMITVLCSSQAPRYETYDTITHKKDGTACLNKGNKK